LGLGARFTGDELKAAYRSAAAMYHPDRYASSSRDERQSAEDLMKKVNEAYERLKKAVKA
jgi:DnaJ-class molecular chaperone